MNSNQAKSAKAKLHAKFGKSRSHIRQNSQPKGSHLQAARTSVRPKDPQGRYGHLPWSTGNQLPNGGAPKPLQWPCRLGSAEQGLGLPSHVIWGTSQSLKGACLREFAARMSFGSIGPQSAAASPPQVAQILIQLRVNGGCAFYIHVPMIHFLHVR